jgi:hypothetical protein
MIGGADQAQRGTPDFPGKTKKAAEMEQKAVVAASSQSRTINAPASPRSNQIEATVFD